LSEDRFRRDDDYSVSEKSPSMLKLTYTSFYSRLAFISTMFATLLAGFFVFHTYMERSSNSAALQADFDQVVDALEVARVQNEELRSQLLSSESSIATLKAQNDEAAEQLQRLTAEISDRPEAPEFLPIKSGTVAFPFGTRIVSDTDASNDLVDSFAFTRSVVPAENVRINSDTIVPAFRSHPTVSQSQSIRWKRQNLVGYLEPQTELLVLQIIEAGETYWIEACIVTGDDCG